MLQKIIQVGNSLAITIPKSFITAINFPKDGVVKVNPDYKKGEIVIEFVTEKQTAEEIIDKEVYEVGKQLLKRYLPAFQELAKK